ncbi:MAG: hypothetical protein ACRECH_13935, partial [Nitrososphaerales archaeon]
MQKTRAVPTESKNISKLFIAILVIGVIILTTAFLWYYLAYYNLSSAVNNPYVGFPTGDPHGYKSEPLCCLNNVSLFVGLNSTQERNGQEKGPVIFFSTPNQASNAYVFGSITACTNYTTSYVSSTSAALGHYTQEIISCITPGSAEIIVYRIAPNATACSRLDISRPNYSLTSGNLIFDSGNISGHYSFNIFVPSGGNCIMVNNNQVSDITALLNASVY